MLVQQFPPQDIPIFGDNTNQSIGVFCMLAHQLGQGVHLPFEAIKPPNDVLHDARRRLAGWKTHHASRFSDGGFFRHRLPYFIRLYSGCVRSILSAPDRVNPSHFGCILLEFVTVKNILTMVLAGGKGERLHPLTLHRAKPAVRFGGKYRIIDSTLSNCFNSGLRKIAVLIQYKSYSLDRHIRTGWSVLNPEVGEFIASIPPQQRISEDWYRGTADAVHQNMFLLDNERSEYLLILAGDHIYKMNYAEMYEFLVEKQADAVVGALEFPLTEASRFGVVGVDDDFRIQRWDEKPANPTPMPGDPNQALVSMGIYLFKTDVIRQYLADDAQQESAHDFGKNIIPQMIQQGRVYAFKFHDKNKKAVKYWRDIGTLDAYWEANMDLVAVDPLFNLYDQEWPLRTYQGQYPPAKFVFAQDYEGGRMGVALDSIVCGGCIISGARVQNSVLSPDIVVQDYSEVRESVVMERVRIGEQCKIRRAIIDKDVIIPPKTEIGYDLDLDRQRFHVTESGLVVISKGMKLDAAINPPG